MPLTSPDQVWFDNPASLAPKYAVAAELGLGGVGFWNLDLLDYQVGDERAKRQTADMWEAVKVYTGHGSNG